MATTGILIGVGVGPGDPELLTLKAVRLLGAAPVVAFIHAPGRESMARAIAMEHLNPSALHIAMEIPMDMDVSVAAKAYDAQMKDITEHLDRGDDVIFLCEGDPLFYGSFLSVLDRLGGQYQTQVVPGITSVAASAAAIPAGLARRAGVFSVIPATLDEDDLALWLAGTGSAAIIKAGPHLGKVKRVLTRLGLEARAFFCERVGFEDQRVVPLSDIEDAQAGYFSLILILERKKL